MGNLHHNTGRDKITNAEILERLDVRAEYEKMGIEFTTSKPNSQGWLTCRAFGKKDRNPSAGVKVASGGKGAIGDYKEFNGDGRYLPFFEACAAFCPEKWLTWNDARDHFREVVGLPAFRAVASRTHQGTNNTVSGKSPLGKGGFADSANPASEVIPKDKCNKESDGVSQQPTTFRENIRLSDLVEPHLEKYVNQKRGISAEACRLAGAKSGRWPSKAPVAYTQSVLAFPILNPSEGGKFVCTGFVVTSPKGEQLSLYQGKDNPPIKKKILTVKGSESGLLNVHGVKSLKSADIVWIVEGLTDMLALQSAIPEDLRKRHVVITNSGGASETPKAAWIELLRDKTVYVVRDRDTPGIKGAQKWVSALVGGVAKEVRNVELPYRETEDHGKDVRDYLSEGHSYADLLELAERTLPSAASPENGLTPIEAPDDPHRLARNFIGEQCQHADGLTVRSWREQWYKWDGSVYCEFPDAELRAALTVSAKAQLDCQNIIAQKRAVSEDKLPKVQKITKSMIDNMEMALASMTLLEGTIEPPIWWDGQASNRRNLIALRNGLLDLDALFAGQGEVLLPHTPRWFSLTCLPYPFDVDADCPRWQAFLNRNLEADQERINLLQEWFGYCLTANTSRQKFMVFEGEGSNGKSVACAALEALLGSENCSHVPLEVFGERFQLTPTIGKLANIASEVGELDRAAEGTLKSFTSGDSMQFDRKHKSPIQALPTARLVLATNNRPRFTDRSGGLWRRMILLPFRVVIAENDPNRVYGMDKPAWWRTSGELSGILNWALAGLDRLRQQDRFTRSEICEQALSDYRIESNPARMFLLDSCREEAEGQTACGELYRAYRAWCVSSCQ